MQWLLKFDVCPSDFILPFYIYFILYAIIFLPTNNDFELLWNKKMVFVLHTFYFNSIIVTIYESSETGQRFVQNTIHRRRALVRYFLMLRGKSLFLIFILTCYRCKRSYLLQARQIRIRKMLHNQSISNRTAAFFCYPSTCSL